MSQSNIIQDIYTILDKHKILIYSNEISIWFNFTGTIKFSELHELNVYLNKHGYEIDTIACIPLGTTTINIEQQ